MENYRQMITHIGAPIRGESSQVAGSEVVFKQVKIEPIDLEEEEYAWVVDTGATRHMCANRSLFYSYQHLKDEKVMMSNSTTSDVIGFGHVQLNLTTGRSLILQNVLHVPDLLMNVVSGSQLTCLGSALVFDTYKFRLIDEGEVIAEGTIDGGLWMMDLRVVT